MQTPKAGILTALTAVAFLPIDIAAGATPLFDRDDTLRVRLEAPLTTLVRERSDEEELPGRMTIPGADGADVTVDVQIRTRGRYRRQRSTCLFPPVRLNFRTSQLDGTLFEDQDKLKLVTHCNSRRSLYEQYLLREFLAYRLLNTLTDRSFRVRMLEVTYVDTEDDGETLVKPGFVIEDDEDLAARNQLEVLKSGGLEYEELDPEFTNLIMVYQFMIGNTDFSLIRGPADDDCCHNSMPMSDGTAVWSVPYDFDMSGLVDAPYAAPSPRMKIRSVTDRQYRGQCANNQFLPATFERFRAARDEIFAVLAAVDGLDPAHEKRVDRFLQQFFAIIDDPKDVEREFVRGCS